jgi:hypothetical protein
VVHGAAAVLAAEQLNDDVGVDDAAVIRPFEDRAAQF